MFSRRNENGLESGPGPPPVITMSALAMPIRDISVLMLERVAEPITSPCTACKAMPIQSVGLNAKTALCWGAIEFLTASSLPSL